MRILKYSALTVAALITAGVIVYIQSVGRADKMVDKSVKPISIGKQRKAAKQKPLVSVGGTPSSSVAKHTLGIVSAMPVDPQSPAERERRAAFAPSDAFSKEGKMLYEGGDLAGAEQAYLNALGAAPIIQGQTQNVPFVERLLGQVYLKDGQYGKAVHWLEAARRTTVTIGGGLDLDLALAYARSGDYKNAARFYSDNATLQYHFEGKDVLPQDLPGKASPQALEASILLARGLNTYLEARPEEALEDFQAASRLAPNNGLSAFYCGRVLTEKGRYSEAAPYFSRAASTGRGLIGEESKSRFDGIQATLSRTGLAGK